MISHLHKNRTRQQLNSNRSSKSVIKVDENRLNDTAAISSYHQADTIERILILEDSDRSFNHSSTTSSMSHLTAEEPVLDETKIEELLDLVRGYGRGC